MLNFNRTVAVLKQSRWSLRNGIVLVSATIAFVVLYTLAGTDGGRLIQWKVFQWHTPGGPVVHQGNADYGFNNKASVRPSVDWAKRAEKVKEAFVHAYSGYESFAFPHDELLSLSDTPRDIFNGWGVTVFDSLDTMLLMGLDEEFKRALSHVQQSNFSLRHNHTPGIPTNSQVSFFETVIRYLGGMLSAYALSHESILLQKADKLAMILAPAFDTGSGLPFIGFDASSGFVNTASVVGKKEHYDRSAKIFDNLQKINLTLTGMIPTRLMLDSGMYAELAVSVGAGADSGHEYLLKYYLMTGQRDRSSIDMCTFADSESLLYVTDISGFSGKPSHNMEHLSCFFPGLLALGVHTLPNEVFTNLTATFAPLQRKLLSPYNMRDLHLWAAIGLGETCWQMYADQPTGLGIEIARMVPPAFNSAAADSELWINVLANWRARGSRTLPPGVGRRKSEKDSSRRDYTATRSDYLLRPETVESMYFLWKTTGDQRWRERGWAIFEAIEKEAKTISGYATVKNVSMPAGELSNDMPSFFLAETLKYLYLLFLNEDPLPLDKWVFNTEAHPLPIFRWSSQDAYKFGIS